MTPETSVARLPAASNDAEPGNVDVGRGRSPWPRRLGLVGLAACSFILAIAVQRNIFPLYSGDNDEPVYVWQAQNMLDGRATVPASEQEQFFRPWLTGRAGDRLVPAFTPGWPAALAAGELVFSTMLVSVGLAAAGATIACYGFAREVFGEQRRALIASAIFALSPFFVMLSGTYAERGWEAVLRSRPPVPSGVLRS
jgi:4-amino-4-deoxy-L-arabinose transferase-like glycosyltransferase